MPPKKKKDNKKKEKKSTISKSMKKEIEEYVPTGLGIEHKYRECIEYEYTNHWADWKKPRNNSKIKYKVKPRTYFLQQQFDRFNIEVLEEEGDCYTLKENDPKTMVETFKVYIKGGGVEKVYGNPFRTKQGLNSFVTSIIVGLYWYHSQMEGKK